MYVKKYFTLRDILNFSWMHIVWITAWVNLITVVDEFTDDRWVLLPRLPL